MVMDLLTPTNHADAYEWASVLLAHFTVGLVLTAIIAAVTEWRAWVALACVIAAYGLLWEGAVQHLGAGVADAFVDTFAVAIGGLVGLSAWLRRGVMLAAGVAALAGVLWAGVRKR